MNKRWISLCLAAALLLGMLGVVPQAQAANLNANFGTVRVYLASMGSVSTVHIKPYGTYTVNGKGALLDQMTDMQVMLTNGKLYLQNGTTKTALGTNFTLKRHGNIAVTNMMKVKVGNYYYNYPGDIQFKVNGSAIMVIVHVNTEDYLYGVLPHEMSNSWPLEALKAQAVAARNYVVRKISQGEPNYEVVDNTNDQVFRGVNTKNDNCIKAVNETRGQILTYNGQIGYVYYGESNGGQTELPGNTWGGGNQPYSVMFDDPYDYENPSARRASATVKKDLGSGSNEAFKNKILAATKTAIGKLGYSTEADAWSFVSLNSLVACDPKYAEPSRVYKNLQFVVSVQVTDPSTGEKKTLTDVSFKINFFTQLKAALKMGLQTKDVELVYVEETASAFKIETRRWGHGVGMSQRGTQTLVKYYNKTYKDVLAYYFPGTTLTTVDVTRTAIPAIPTVTVQPTEPGATPTPKPTATSTPIGEYATVTLGSSSSNLAFRSQPSSSGAIVGYLNHGMVLPVVGYEGSWVKLSYEGYEGWAHKDYLKISKTVPTATPAATATPAPTATPAADAAIEQKGIVRLATDASLLKFRDRANSNGALIGELRNNQEVTIVEVCDGWYEVTALVGSRETTGFASAEYIEPQGKFVATVTAQTGTNAMTTTETGAERLLRLAAGSKPEVVAIGTKWTKVRLNGKIGFVRNSTLTIVKTQ